MVMKRFLSLISAAVLVMTTALPTLAGNKTAPTQASKTSPVASTATNRTKSEAKTTAKRHAGSKAEHGKTKQEKKA